MSRANRCATAEIAQSERPLKLKWNRNELMRAYDDIEALRHAIAQPTESGLNTSLLVVLDAIEAADIEWDAITRSASDEQVSA